jgi:hypothetical protein
MSQFLAFLWNLTLPMSLTLLVTTVVLEILQSYPGAVFPYLVRQVERILRSPRRRSVSFCPTIHVRTFHVERVRLDKSRRKSTTATSSSSSTSLHIKTAMFQVIRKMTRLRRKRIDPSSSHPFSRDKKLETPPHDPQVELTLEEYNNACGKQAERLDQIVQRVQDSL